MKDSRGRTIKKGDKLVYSSSGGVTCVNCAEVISAKPLKARVLSSTEYGTMAGKIVTLGAHSNGLPLHNVMVIESEGFPVDFSQVCIKRWDSGRK